MNSVDYCSGDETEECISPAGHSQHDLNGTAEFYFEEDSDESDSQKNQSQENVDHHSVHYKRAMFQKSNRSLSILGRSLNVPRNSVCGNSTIHSVQSMRSGDATRKNTKILLENPNLFARALSEKLTGPWIEHAFEKRECVKFIGTQENSDRCGCGRLVAAHSQLAQSRFSVFSPPVMAGESWSIDKHTHVSPTDAFGTLVFQGGAHAHKAQYVRLGYDSNPADVMYLMEKVWGLQPPRLVITVHGGMTNFQVQEKIGRLFREGLLKAAQTTGAWILTSGIDSGIVRHVAQALDEAGISARMRSKIVTIGFAPWGVLKKRERLISKDLEIQYDSHSFGTSSGMGVLNDRHSYFLLADNGTSGRYGAEQHLRQNFENYLASQCNGSRHVPVVGAVLEGGSSTVKAVYQYVTKEPDIPVIVCDGSGRASDLLSFAWRSNMEHGEIPREIREQLVKLTATVFSETQKTQLDQFVNMIIESAQRPDLLTIFGEGEDQQDVDHAILTAVLKGHNLSLPEQLSLTLSWNRVDVARECCFSDCHNWPIGALHTAMNEALRLDRVEFVELLLENGVSMKTFLTLSSLETLYNQDDDTQHSVRIFVDKAPPTVALTLPDIGLIIERLMGNAYKHYYTSRHFKSNYDRFRKKAQLSRLSSFHIRLVSRSPAKRRKSGETRGPISDSELRNDFSFPYNDLIMWAILTRRPEMARCMWLHGEDAMAKGLVAIRLYKAIGRIAEEEYLEVEVANKLREHAEEFRGECHHLLDFCYREDNEQTLRLLTAELPHWGHHNCLSLAVLANNKQFLAHPCCQMLLADLWHGSLRVRSGSNIRVLTSLLFPPAALFLAFKTPRVPPEEPAVEPPSEHEEIYETISSFQSRNTEKQSSVGSMLSIPFNKIFKKGSLKLKDKEGETEELMENGMSPPKKVTIISSKKNSAVFHDSSLSVNAEPPIPTMSSYAKLRAFYSAPITKFWSWCIAFHIFLAAFSYVLLIETPLEPTRVEWYLLIYMCSFGIEHARKLCCQETSKFWNKAQMFYSKYYNFLTLIALLSFWMGFGLRLNPLYRHSYGRIILCCSNVLWYMKVLEYLSVHPLLGPYIQMAAKMVVSMCYIIVLLLVTLMAFGVSRQAITFPKEKVFEWQLVRNIFYKPYFMLYGEVYAGEIDTCGDEAERARFANETFDEVNCVPGYFIPPLLMTIFLLVANILLINMLIAIFNNIFNDTNVRSKEVWLFQRYGQIMEYNDTPLLPPPFTTLSHIMFLFCKSCKCRKNKAIKANQKTFFDFSMKLNLTPEELRAIHDFEEDCMDELTRKKLRRGQGTPEERWTQAIEQSEVMSGRLNELVLENFSLRNRLCEMEEKLDWIVKNQTDLINSNKRKRGVNFRASSQSLPDESPSPLSPSRDPFMDHLLIPVDEMRLSARSPLIQNLRRDQLQKKYDEARLNSPLIQRRPRLNSSSLSISQDMRDMSRSKKGSVSISSSEEEESPRVVVTSPWGSDN